MRTHSKIYTLEKYYACLYVSPSSKKSIYHQLFYGYTVTGVTGKSSWIGYSKKNSRLVLFNTLSLLANILSSSMIQFKLHNDIFQNLFKTRYNLTHS